MATTKNKNPGSVDTKPLVEAYNRSDEELTTIRQALETAIAKRTETVKAIVAAVGPGPHEFNGKVVKARKRDTKDEQGVVISTTWFFYSIGDEVQKLD